MNPLLRLLINFPTSAGPFLESLVEDVLEMFGFFTFTILSHGYRSRYWFFCSFIFLKFLGLNGAVYLRLISLQNNSIVSSRIRHRLIV